MVVTKAKRSRHFKFRSGGQPVAKLPAQDRRPAMAEPGKPVITVLGTITAEDGEAIAFDIPADLDPEKISSALAAAEAEKFRLRREESARLREAFLGKVALDG
jgi:hypothetical protein